ncbi:MAG: hypothetical protein WC477_06615 [Patescibacteria group bacterium]
MDQKRFCRHAGTARTQAKDGAELIDRQKEDVRKKTSRPGDDETDLWGYGMRGSRDESDQLETGSCGDGT